MHQCSPPRCAAAARPGSPVGLGAHRGDKRARAAYSYATRNLIYVVSCYSKSHISPPPVNARLMPSDDTPLDIFFNFLENSAGRFICMGDKDLALRGVYGALSGRFRVFSKPLPGLGLGASGAFGALFR